MVNTVKMQAHAHDRIAVVSSEILLLPSQVSTCAVNDPNYKARGHRVDQFGVLHTININRTPIIC